MDTSEAKAYAEEQNLLFTEVSAKTGQGVKEVFRSIGEKLYASKKDEILAKKNRELGNRVNNSVDINAQRPSTNDTTTCCS